LTSIAADFADIAANLKRIEQEKAAVLAVPMPVEQPDAEPDTDTFGCWSAIDYIA
jgi:hypothetical protein